MKTAKAAPRKNQSKFLPRIDPATGGKVVLAVGLHRSGRDGKLRSDWKLVDQRCIWRERRAKALWKAAQKLRPDSVIACDRAQGIAKEIVEHLSQYAPCCLGGMVGQYWGQVLARRELWQEEAQALASQLWGICRLERSPREGRNNKGKRGASRPGALTGNELDPSSGTPLEMAEASEWINKHKDDPDVQAAFRDLRKELKRGTKK